MYIILSLHSWWWMGIWLSFYVRFDNKSNNTILQYRAWHSISNELNASMWCAFEQNHLALHRFPPSFLFERKWFTYFKVNFLRIFSFSLLLSSHHPAGIVNACINLYIFRATGVRKKSDKNDLISNVNFMQKKKFRGLKKMDARKKNQCCHRNYSVTKY